MSDEGGRKELFDQDPDLKEDFGHAEWPFSDKGGLDDIPLPVGEACVKINSVLSHASEHSGDFSFGGLAEQLPAVPGLFVDDVGPIPVPLWDERARILIDKAEKSPFGHKMDTKMDENVRKSWQVSADHVHFKNPQWEVGIREMAVMIGDQLGYKDIALHCILYKLLVYEEGGHFVKHQDTEKEDGMIATLVIQPPSLHEGGDLVVYGDGKIKHRHDFGKSDGKASYLPHYAVHYADAEHALEEVTKGYRLALVYSVCLPPTKRQWERNPNRPMAGELTDIMETMKPSDSCFALLLSHEYTENSITSLGSHALKGVDRARFLALEEANAALSDGKKLEFVIAELYHHVSFYGMYGDIGDWDEESREEKVTWYTTNGVRLGVSGSVKLNFLNPIQETRAQLWMEPYGSSDMHGYMGNEGPTKDSRYNRYAIVAWSKVDREEYMSAFIDNLDAHRN
ncbi:hypothetical protein DVH05_001849 [Phytophthora capsici]|nr:hypothetical protein DVH05_001849 [Phytophthora capsici]